MKKRTLEELENQSFEAGPRHYASRFGHHHTHPHPHATLLSGVMIGVLSTLIILSSYVYKIVNEMDYTNQNNLQTVIRVSPVPTITGILDNSKWKLFTDITDYGTGEFSIEYPPEWEQDQEVKKVFYPLKGNREFIVSLGQAGAGRSSGWSCEDKQFPAGEAHYCFVVENGVVSREAVFPSDNISYIIRMRNIPQELDSEYILIFDKMLSTLNLIKVKQ